MLEGLGFECQSGIKPDKQEDHTGTPDKCRAPTKALLTAADGSSCNRALNSKEIVSSSLQKKRIACLVNLVVIIGTMSA